MDVETIRQVSQEFREHEKNSKVSDEFDGLLKERERMERDYELAIVRVGLQDVYDHMLQRAIAGHDYCCTMLTDKEVSALRADGFKIVDMVSWSNHITIKREKVATKRRRIRDWFKPKPKAKNRYIKAIYWGVGDCPSAYNLAREFQKEQFEEKGLRYL